MAAAIEATRPLKSMKYFSSDTLANVDGNGNRHCGTPFFVDLLAEKHRKIMFVDFHNF